MSSHQLARTDFPILLLYIGSLHKLCLWLPWEALKLLGEAVPGSAGQHIAQCLCGIMASSKQAQHPTMGKLISVPGVKYWQLKEADSLTLYNKHAR